MGNESKSQVCKNVLINISIDAMGDTLAVIPHCERYRQLNKCNLTVCTKKHFIKILNKNYNKINFVTSFKKEDFDEILDFSEFKNQITLKNKIFLMKNLFKDFLKTDFLLKRPKLNLSKKRIIKEPYVCIATQSTSYNKNWNHPNGWIDVIKFLTDVLGYRVIDIDLFKNQKYFFDFSKFHITHSEKIYQHIPYNSEDFTGKLPLQKRIDIIKDADFFIGLSSGLSWLAWACNIPVVMISGFTPSKNEFYTPFRVTNTEDCYNCFRNSKKINTCNRVRFLKENNHFRILTKCSMNITPQMVIDKITQIPIVREKLVKFWENQGKFQPPTNP